MLHGRFKVHHELYLKGIAKMQESSSTIAPGVSLDTGEGACVFMATNPRSSSVGVYDPPGSEDDASMATHAESERADLEKEVDEEEEEEALSRDLLDVLYVSLDNMHLRT
jgi:hypothetical protein